MKPIPYGRHAIDQEDIRRVTEALQSDFLTTGPAIPAFEKQVAHYHGCRYAVAFANGTAALHGAYFAAGVTEGDECIVPVNTFVATANGGVYLGAFPVLCDIHPVSYNLDWEKVWPLVNERTKVIAPVSYAGNPVALVEAFTEANRRHILLIHDAAHAIGSRVDGAGICDHAHMAILSFHPVKHVTTGEGGMVLTNSPELFKRLLLFRTHGITKNPADFADPLERDQSPGWYYEMQALGYNYRLTDLQCVLGISQMEKLNFSLFRRNQIALAYDRAFESLPWLTTPANPFHRGWLDNPPPEERSTVLPLYWPESLHAYHLYPVLVDKKVDRRAFFHYLQENNIQAQVHYIPVHFMPYYQRRFGYRLGQFPLGEGFYQREISLPIYPTLEDSQQEYVIDTVKRFGKDLSL